MCNISQDDRVSIEISDGLRFRDSSNIAGFTFSFGCSTPEALQPPPEIVQATSVAEPVFILVSGVAVVHVHAFALDGQAFLKEDDKNQSSAPGKASISSTEQAVLEGRDGGRGTPNR